MPLTKTVPFSKTQKAFEFIAGIASKLPAEAKLPTIRQLQRDLNVSIATLDKVLSQLETQKIIYRRQGSGIYVSPYLHRKTVGLICAPGFFRSSTSPFWSELVEDVRQRASLDGEVFRFYLGLPASRSHMPVHEDLQEDVAANRLEGVLFMGHNPSAIAWLEAQGIPVVNFAGRARYKVVINYHNLIQRAVTALVQAGCERIGMMSPFQHPKERNRPQQFNATAEFQSILSRQKLPFFPEFVWDADTISGLESQSYHEQGFAAACRIFSASTANYPDGLVIIDDMMTSGALAGLQKMKISLGPRLHIASYCNRKLGILQNVEQRLLLFEIDPADIIQAMLSLLHTLMDGKKPAESTISIKAHPKGTFPRKAILRR